MRVVRIAVYSICFRRVVASIWYKSFASTQHSSPRNCELRHPSISPNTGQLTSPPTSERCRAIIKRNNFLHCVCDRANLFIYNWTEPHSRTMPFIGFDTVHSNFDWGCLFTDGLTERPKQRISYHSQRSNFSTFPCRWETINHEPQTHELNWCIFCLLAIARYLDDWWISWLRVLALKVCVIWNWLIFVLLVKCAKMWTDSCDVSQHRKSNERWHKINIQLSIQVTATSDNRNMPIFQSPFQTCVLLMPTEPPKLERVDRTEWQRKSEAKNEHYADDNHADEKQLFRLCKNNIDERYCRFL